MFPVLRRRVRPTLDAGFARTGEVLETTIDRATGIAGIGVERVGDVVDTVRPAISRAFDNAEMPDALRQALEAGSRTVTPGSRRARCGRRGRVVVPAVLAVAAATVVCLVVVRRRRNRPEPPPEGASA